MVSNMGKGTISHTDGTIQVTHCEDYNSEYEGCAECPFYAGCKIPSKINPSKRRCE